MTSLLNYIQGCEIVIACRLIGLSLISVLIYWCHFYEKIQKPSSKRSESLLAYPFVNRKIIPLHEYEARDYFFGGAVSTITWFEGNAAQAAPRLRDRVKEIVRLNPWLAGTLTNASGLSIIFDNIDTVDDAILDRLFSFHNTEKSFYLGAPLNGLAETALKQGLICPNASKIVKNGSPFFQVTIIRDGKKPDDRFALIMSLSHRVGDGHTFYSIYNMLSSSTPLYALNPVRRMHVFDEIERVTRKKLLVQSFWSSIRFTFTILWLKLRNQKLGPVHIVSNPEFIRRKKIESIRSDSSTPIISTNDVLVSTCFNYGKCDVGLMPVNFRERVSDCKKTDAGNYTTSIKYFPRDYETPSMIRKSIAGPYFEPVISSMTLVETPNVLSFSWKKPRIMICTNWSGFVVDKFEIEGSKQLVHFPFWAISQMQNNGYGDKTTCTIYKPWSGQTAMMINGESRVIENFKAGEFALPQEAMDLIDHDVKKYF
jgi:hypothetical protein